MSSNSARQAVLELSGLSVSLVTGEPVLEGVDLRLGAGEILGIVGESGSGKTTAALSLFGYATPGTRITGGELRIAGQRHRMDESMRPIRGSTIAYVPQDPSRALNPSLKIAAAVNDVLRAHGAKPSGAEAAVQVLRRVGLGETGTFAARYPHQTSGGQQQRVAIAIALCCDPTVVVLDEPTTGLDVVTQARILEELRSLRAEQEVSMVYVTHDLSVLAEIADRIAVMYAGRVVEEGPAERLLRSPCHPYTRGLLASIPDHVRPRVLQPMPGIAVAVGEWPTGCRFAPRCPQRSGRCEEELPPLETIAEGQRVRCFHYQATPQVRSVSLDVLARLPPESAVLTVEDLGAEHRSHREVTVAATSISFSVGRGECVALVGESGSGKTTVARTIAGLHPIARGRVLLHGAELASLAARRTREQRRQIQIVFQNPAGTLNPQHTVFQTLARPARVLRKLDRSETPAEVDRLLGCVRLPTRIAERYPHELSGGERQRVAIARALAADPEIILCDEITSALDVSVQAAVLKLLRDLRDEFGLGLLFITHDLGVVATVADTVLVLERGSIVDHGPITEVLRTPSAEYTARLLQAAPSISNALSGRSGTREPSKPSPFPAGLSGG